jgi:hypothetical protein
MAYKDHEPVVLDKFNGLWNRNDPDSTPLDHFQDCNNLRYYGQNSFGSRFGIAPAQNVAAPITNIKRVYNYPTNTGNTLIALSWDGAVGSIYHMIDSTTSYGPILTIRGMSDFAFLPYAGRAYISPFSSLSQGDLTIEKGLDSEFVYVYKGDGTPARQAAGSPLSGNLSIANGGSGYTDAGFHIFGFVAETDTGYLTSPGALKSFTTSGSQSVSFGNVPTGKLVTTSIGQFIPSNPFISLDEEYEEEQIFCGLPTDFPLEETVLNDSDDNNLSLTPYPNEVITITTSPYIVKRHLVASKVITNFNGDLEGYTLYFVPNAIIYNNTDLFLNNISFFDQDLIDDASHLFDNYPAIPAVSSLSLYRNRLVGCCTSTNLSLGLVSHDGEPEAISQIDGIIAVPPDGNPINNSQELRDVLYVFKRTRTYSFSDNGDEPSTWPLVTVDQGLGTCVHGISTALDTNSANVDYLIIATYQGISLFNGRYVTPELSWKVEGFWRALDRNSFGKIQFANALIRKELFCVLPDGTILNGNYGNGMDPYKMRWTPISYPMGINSVAIWNIDDIIFGADAS